MIFISPSQCPSLFQAPYHWQRRPVFVPAYHRRCDAAPCSPREAVNNDDSTKEHARGSNHTPFGCHGYRRRHHHHHKMRNHHRRQCFRRGPLSVTNHETELQLSLDLPGVVPNNLRVQRLDNGTELQVRAERTVGHSYVYERSFALDRDTMDVTQIRATWDHGVLQLTIPKKKQDSSNQDHFMEVPVVAAVDEATAAVGVVVAHVDVPGWSNVRVGFHRPRGMILVRGTTRHGEPAFVRVPIAASSSTPIQASGLTAFWTAGVLQIAAPTTVPLPNVDISVQADSNDDDVDASEDNDGDHENNSQQMTTITSTKADNESVETVDAEEAAADEAVAEESAASRDNADDHASLSSQSMARGATSVTVTEEEEPKIVTGKDVTETTTTTKATTTVEELSAETVNENDEKDDDEAVVVSNEEENTSDQAAVDEGDDALIVTPEDDDELILTPEDDDELILTTDVDDEGNDEASKETTDDFCLV